MLLEWLPPLACAVFELLPLECAVFKLLPLVCAGLGVIAEVVNGCEKLLVIAADLRWRLEDGE